MMALDETKGVRIYADTHQKLRILLAKEGKGATMADAIERLLDANNGALPVGLPSTLKRIAASEIRKAKP